MSLSTSIIIPSYNHGQYLRESIESALAQTSPAKEVIVVDDGSVDNSPSIVQSYPVRLIVQEHRGAHKAMARGVSDSSGDCFVMLGADDRLAQDYVEKTTLAMGTHPRAAFVYSAVDLFGTVVKHVPARPFSLARILAANYVSGTALTRRAAYDETQGYSAIDIAKYEDWHLFLSMLERGWIGVPTNETTFFYRQHAQSRNTLPGKDHEHAIRRIMKDHPRLYRPSPYFWYFLHRQLFRRFPRLYVALLMGLCAVTQGKYS